MNTTHGQAMITPEEVARGSLRPQRAGYAALCSDGEPVTIQAVTAAHRDDLLALMLRSSDRSLYQRFCSSGVASSRLYVDELLDPRRTLDAVVARWHGRLVAVGSTHPAGTAEAEVALLVEDAHRHRGVGTLLLADLVARARARGLRALVAVVLNVDTQMLEVIRRSGLSMQDRREGDETVSRILLDEDDTQREAIGRRDLATSSRSVGRLLSPTSVVVVGAGHRRDGVGHQMVAHLRRARFTGTIYALNRSGRAVCSVPAYRKIVDLPGGIDLAVIAVRGSEVPDLATALVGQGVGAIVLLSAGSAETPAGAERQRWLRDLCRRAGVRLLGPDSLGVLNTDPGVRLDATLLPTAPRAGGVAIVSQSGAVASGLAAELARRGVGVSTLASHGDAWDVDAPELVAYAAQNPATRVTAVYLDGVHDPDALRRTASATTATTPLILMTPGHTPSPVAAATTYPATAADDAAVDALCRRAGITRVTTLGDLVDLAALQASQPAPHSARTAVVGNAYGPGVIALDACGELGLQAPSYTQHTLMRLRRLLPRTATIGPLVDTTTGVSPGVLHAALETVVEDPGVDSLVVVVTPSRPLQTAAVQAMVEHVADTHRDVTVVLCVMGGGVQEMRRVPCFSDPARAVAALARHAAWGRWVERRLDPHPSAPRPPPAELEVARDIVRTAMLEDPQGRWLEPDEVRGVLTAYGIATVPTIDVRTPEAAGGPSACPHPPVLVTVDHGPTMARTSARGAVATGLLSELEVRQAADEMAVSLGDDARGSVVQPMVGGRREMIVGAVRRPRWGGLVTVARGGTDADADPERQCALAPCSVHEADAMVHSLRCADAVTAPSEKDPSGSRLARLVSAVSRLVADLTGVVELELNPVLAGDGDPVVVEARIRVASDEGTWVRSVRHLRL